MPENNINNYNITDLLQSIVPPMKKSALYVILNQGARQESFPGQAA